MVGGCFSPARTAGKLAPKASKANRERRGSIETRDSILIVFSLQIASLSLATRRQAATAALIFWTLHSFTVERSINASLYFGTTEGRIQANKRSAAFMPLHGQNSWRREKFGNARFSTLKRRPPSAVLLRRTGKRRAPAGRFAPNQSSALRLLCDAAR